jgi:hypothetical protein
VCSNPFDGARSNSRLPFAALPAVLLPLLLACKVQL